jgi:hypothetical protein
VSLLPRAWAEMASMIVLIVCALLYGGVLVVLFQKNTELAEAVKGHEEHIRELEKYLNPTEKDSMIRSRLSTTETRVTALDRAVKAHATDIDMVSKQVQALLGNPSAVRFPQPGQAAANDAQKFEEIGNQLMFVNDRVNSIANRVDLIVTAQNNLAMKALVMEKTNVCIFASADSCPPRMVKTATFGIIAHSGQSPVPHGYWIGGPFNDNGWNWLHGSYCCTEE